MNTSFPPIALAHLILTLPGTKLNRQLAKTIPNIQIFESVRRGEITPEQGAEIMMLQNESEYWIVRMWRKYVY